MVFTLLAYVPFLTIALVAQWIHRYRWVRWIAFGMILLFAGLILAAGGSTLLVAISPEMEEAIRAESPEIGGANWGLFSAILIVTALLGPLFLLRQARRLLARWLPIDAESAIDATAIALAVLVAGLNLSQVPLIGGLEELASGTVQLTLPELLISNLPIGLFALVGVGLFIRRDAEETWERLGVRNLTWGQLGLTVLLAVLILGAYYAIDAVWYAVAPENYEMMEAIGDTLFGSATSLWASLAVSLVAGVTEELFFRGAIQPRFGLVLTAIFFTAVHVQYGFTLATLEVFIAGLALGMVRRRANTSACILLHVLYDVGALFVFPLLP